MIKQIEMNPTYKWNPATKIPEFEDYNKDGAVIVAYEDGSVSKGYYSIYTKRWAFEERHGRALCWTRYPEHPKKEEKVIRL